MCGIVGLFLKNPKLEPQLGRLSAEMLGIMSERGPDSAGFAVYGAGAAEATKLTLRIPNDVDAAGLAAALNLPVVVRGDHAIVIVPQIQEAALRVSLAKRYAGIGIVATGTRIELYKGIGLPDVVSARYGLPGMGGTHAIGHTRMATESAVTIHGAHPFSTGPDQCLVHNGSLSNHNALRRTLRREGLEFETENDSEVAAGYLTWRIRQGASLGEALEAAVADLDGFYTFVVGTERGFGVLRDPIACKPAVMAETEDYVAFGSEYRALVPLPGIERARLFEPAPGQVYFWEHAA